MGKRRERVLTTQTTLDLREPSKHGGARLGAGRPRKKEKDRGSVAHRTRASHRKGDPIHVTLRVAKQLPSLRTQLLRGIVKRALFAQRKKLTDPKSEGESAAKLVQLFQVVHFTIQDNHLHLVVEASDKRAIACGMAGLEVRIARRINQVLGRRGRFWAERYHRRDLRTPTETRNVLRYVLLNSQKHHAVIGDRAFADPQSSAPTFDGYARPPFVFDDPLMWPRVEPRTWLLGTGWRRQGLIDPADVPAASSPHR